METVTDASACDDLNMYKPQYEIWTSDAKPTGCDRPQTAEVREICAAGMRDTFEKQTGA
jgi:hypothetical protein